MKVCFKCMQAKPETEFYRHRAMADGLLNKCRDCTRMDVRKNRLMKLEQYRSYDIQRAKTPARKRKSVANTRRKRKMVLGYSGAHRAVARALRSGVLSRQPCAMCNTTAWVAAHHDDYSRPLEVIWLCPEHHAARHAFLAWLAKSANL